MSELPSGWVEVPLSDISRRVTDGTHQPPKFVDEGVPFLVISNVIAGQIDWTGVSKWVTVKTYEDLTARCRPERGDVLYTAVGSYGVAVLVDTDQRFMFQRHIAHIKPWGIIIDAKFMVHALNSPVLRTHADGVARGVAQKTVTLGDLKEFPIRLPPLVEQRRIVSKLEALTAKSRRAKEALDAIPPLLERFRQSVLAAAFRGDLTAGWREKNPDVEPAEELLKRIRAERRRRWEEAELAKMRAKGKVPGDDRWKEKYEEPEPVDAEGMPEPPEGWAWASLQEVTTEARIGLVRSASEQNTGGGVPYVRMQHYDAMGRWNSNDLTYVHVTPEELDDYALARGDVLFNTRNSYELVGKVAIWREVDSIHVFNNNLMRLRFVKAAPPHWMAYQMISSTFLNRIQGFKSATTSVCAIYGRDLFKQPILIAPLDEATEVVRRLDRATQRIQATYSSINESRTRADELDRSILAKAFCGELVPQDPTDEPASVLLERLRAERTSVAAAAPNGRAKPQASTGKPARKTRKP